MKTNISHCLILVKIVGYKFWFPRCVFWFEGIRCSYKSPETRHTSLQQTSVTPVKIFPKFDFDISVWIINPIKPSNQY